MSNPATVVTSMLEATERRDVGQIVSHLAPEVVYQNVPLPPARGVHAVAKQFHAFHRLYTECEVRVHNIAVNGPVVLTERTDIIRRGAWSAEFWVCGTFEVHEDRITLWRDYYDQATYLAACLRGVGRMVVSGLRKAF
ncbi:limonene-1,2-epoxide hydrolase family protein [Kutzneria sp. NPDC052558]|uniref:limonene-1,2-epoxide hydrolase family protein n=1 Tax=Kutzneria sp. NPDC052558 TaxID=3364121 RepID=UPI0037C6C9B5